MAATATRDADRDDAIDHDRPLSTLRSRAAMTVLLPVEQVVDFGRDPADSCPMRSHQRVGAVAHVCVGAHVGLRT